MMRRMVRAQRPHCGLQPRQPYTWLAVAGRAGALSRADRTSRSLNTLQEQTIIAELIHDPVGLHFDLGHARPACKRKNALLRDSKVLIRLGLIGILLRPLMNFLTPERF